MINREYFSLLYHMLYVLTALIALLSALSIDIKKNYTLQYKLTRYLVVIPILGLILLVGFRAYNVGTDTINYYVYWQTQAEYTLSGEFLFPLIMDLLYSLNFEYSAFLLLTGFSFYLALYLSYKKIAIHYQANIFFIFFSFFSLFIANSLSINVIRQGASLAFLILAYASHLETNNKNKLKIFSLLFVSMAFHTTSVIPIFIYILCYFLKKIKLNYFYFTYAISAILAYLQFSFLTVSPFLIELLVDEKRVGYLSGETYDYTVGFKPQFFLLNTFFLFVFIKINRKILNQRWKDEYTHLIKYYILSSAVLFMAFQIPFSDRFGLFSWIVIPILVAPVFSTSTKKIKRSSQLPWVLLFTTIYIAFYLNSL